MDEVMLKNVLPVVFSDREETDSEIWEKTVVLEKGRFYLLEAASGTGKSSFCSYVYGYRDDYKGEICFDGRDIRTFSVSCWTSLRNRSLSLLFQDLRLFPELTAYENVLLKNNLTHYKPDGVIGSYFERLGIADKMNAPVGKMSFGQQQRVAVIRALCQPFDFIFLDEPVSHLDDENGSAVSALLSEEARTQGAGVVVTSIGKALELDYTKVFRL